MDLGPLVAHDIPPSPHPLHQPIASIALRSLGARFRAPLPRCAFLERRALRTIAPSHPAQRLARLAKEMAARARTAEDKACGVIAQAWRLGGVAVRRCGLSLRHAAAVGRCGVPA